MKIVGMVAILLAVAGAGCGGTQKNKTPGTTPAGHGSGNAGGEAGQAPGDALVSGEGSGADEEQAYQAALGSLAEAVYGPTGASWAPDLDALHQRDLDPMARSESGGRIRIELGLAEERVVALLDALAERPLSASAEAPGPAEPLPLASALGDTIARAYVQHRERLVCERRQALLGDTCTPPATDEVDAELGALARSVRLRPFYVAGVPLGAGREPLRPIKIVTELAGRYGAYVPVAGLPLELSIGVDEPIEAIVTISDQSGVATVALPPGQAFPDEVRAGVDRDRLLGPLAEMWPAAELYITGREISPARLGALVAERVDGQATGDGVFAASLGQVLARRGAGQLTVLPAGVAPPLQSLAPGRLGNALAQLADAWEGRIDLLVVVELDSDLARRMGANRVWYEARARLSAYDLWSGKRVATVEDAVTASGVGDDRANHAARAQLAEKLAEALMQALAAGAS